MEQRQHAHDLFLAWLGVGGGPGLALACRRHDAAMRQHRGLRQAGRAAGVLQHRHFVPEIVTHGMGLVFAVIGQQIAERHVPVVARPDREFLFLGQRIEPVLGPRQVVGDRAHDQLLQPRLALHARYLRVQRRDIERNQDVGLGVADLELELAVGIERAVVDDAAAGLEHAEEGDEVVRRVGQVETDVDAGLHAQFLEAGRGAVGGFLVVLVGHHLVEKVGHREVGILSATLVEALVKGLAGYVEFPGHAGWVALDPRIIGHFDLFLLALDYGWRGGAG